MILNLEHISFRKRLGDLDYRRPSSMTLDEYRKYDFDRSIRDYWVQRARGESFSNQRRGIPKLHVGGEVFDRLFGSNTIDIRPQGSAELIFGLNISKTDNPALPEKLRRTTTFDFQEKIQMNVTGQIGDKLKLATNYNTEATFDFENKMNIGYEGKEDEIIQKIEAGDVTMPLSGSLITGSQSLFGIKTELKFGRLTMTNIFSQQKGKTSVIEVEGGAQTTDYDIYVDEYEANKHFFLAQYFYDNYDKALANLPIITSGINITKIEVWVTNKTRAVENSRNIVAFMDLAETDNIYSGQIFPQFQPENPKNYPTDSLNTLVYFFDDPEVRSIDQATIHLESQGLRNGVDFEKIESARKLSPSEYTLNSKLGFISLNSSLNSDEVLGVAFEYTVGGRTYRVGEFSNSGVDAPNALMVKLIKGTSLTPKYPTWQLMMKNVYAIGAYQVNPDEFYLDIMYQNDKTGTAVNYLTAGNIDGKILLKVLNLDNLNSNLDPNSDGVFDFIQGVTINPQNGRVFFPVREPFGEYLREKITNGDPNLDSEADKYVFEELYDSTQSKARQIAEKNKFFLSGSYQSTSGSDISLNALNVPQGSVVVTAGGMKLTENVDYTVDYTLGRVKIINQGLLESGTPIKISLESNSLFNIQSKTLLGTHMDYRFTDDFVLGATIMNLTERPLTQKVSIGDEPISNTIWGINGLYKTDAPYLTKLIDKLPFLETKEMSTITVEGEFAHLIPGHSKAVEKSGTAYIDDFEGSKTTIDVKSIGAWVLASTPQKQDMFPESSLTLSSTNDWETNAAIRRAIGFNRAKLAWYVIDPLFLRNNSSTPDHIKDSEEQDSHFVREIFEKEIFPKKESPQNVPTNLAVLNMAYYPNKKGPYNFDVAGLGGISAGIDANGDLNNPNSRWGGIMREIQTNDFEAANIEYIEFWVMDPFVYDSTHTGGDLYFNLGDISEDILKDSRKMFEDGLPTSSTVELVDTTYWGRVPITQSVVNAFDNDPTSREFQDVGLDGLGDDEERDFFSTYLSAIESLHGQSSLAYTLADADPSSDNYHYYRGDDYDDEEKSILDRYKLYNGLEGNSPTSEQSSQSYPTSATTQPNSEDVNRDNTLSEAENYYQYRVSLRPEDMVVGTNYITDKVEGETDGDGVKVSWYQFKVPIFNPEEVVGDIADFKSIRFLRMFMKNFDDEVILRFATLDLVRGEWRKYNYSFVEAGLEVAGNEAGASFEISAVNIEENGEKSPVNYILPPGISRVIDPTNPQLRQLNEQSMVLKVCNLPDGDARAGYKNLDMDIRQYKKLKMFVHAEAIEQGMLNDDDVTLFVRLGSDYQDNYYEYEVPLKLTPPGTYIDNENLEHEDRYIVWPAENNLEIDFEVLQTIKQKRNALVRSTSSNQTYSDPYFMWDGNNYVTIKGNPNLSNVRTIMVGVRNRRKTNNPFQDNDDGYDKCAEIWINELRLTDFDEKGGWAANARITARLADFGTLTLAGSTSKPGFGSIEKKVNERSQEEVYQYDIASNLELGKFFPEKANVRIPMYIGYSEGIINPEYNPLDPDIPLKVTLADETLSKDTIDYIKDIARDIPVGRA
jgi:cell surface protein SprA